MRLKKILLLFFGTILLLAAGVFVVGKYYNNEVKQFVFTRINQRLTAPLKVGEMELTLFSDFPNASLRLSNVTIADKLSKNQSDTLLYAEKLFLSFNFWDIWNKNYRITKLKVDGGMFHLAYNAVGESNLDIWKKDTTTSSSADFKLDLTSVQIENLFFRFSQPSNGQSLRCFIKTSRLSGNLTADKFKLETALNSRVYMYTINGVNYLNNKDLTVETDLEIDHKKHSIGFNRVKLGINAVNLSIDGAVNYGDNSSVNLHIAGNQISIIELMASLPDFSRESLNEYDTQGFLTINSHLQGKLGNGELPSYTADFTINQASLIEKSSKIKLSSLDLKGRYKTSFSGTDDNLKFDKLAGSFTSGQFNINGYINNFSNPDIKASIVGKVDLEQLSHFLRWKGADTVAGKLAINAQISGLLSRSDTSESQLFNKLKTSGSVALKNGRFKLRGARQTLENVSGEVNLESNLALVKNLSFNTQNSDFLINGVIDNLVPYIFRKDQQMSIEASLQSTRIDLSDFIDEKDNSKDGESARLAFPNGIKGNLTTKIDKLLYRRFSANQISGRILLSPEGLVGENMDLKAFNGRVQGSVIIDRQGDQFLLKNQTTLSNVELDKVFFQFEDFGQQVLTHKEIKGKTDATVTVSAILTNQLQVDVNSLSSTAQLKIRDGELNNLQVLQDLAVYLRSNTAINTVVNCTKLGERLKRVSFSTLENTITIRNKKITIPEMTLKSSALDININGTHSFDNHIDYGLNFRMAEIFRKNEVTEYGYIVDDNTGMRMFIAISGTTENPQFKYDKLSAAQARKEKFQLEKNTFKSLLKQELGLFKKDSTLKTVNAPAKAGIKFELEYDNKKPATQPTLKNPIPTNTPAKSPAPPVKEQAPKKKSKKDIDDKDYNLDDDI